ncbi:MAG TPA: hypothetical protein VFB52_14165 [Solirubrobacterales bacterium]|nr:hypothetical protein [Solirubrobacterales bacterium]
MIHRGKVLGLLLAVALATGAFTAVAAQAEPLFEANSYPATITGDQVPGEELVLTVEKGLSTECETRHFHALISEATSSVTATTEQAGCKAFGFITATVNQNGCEFRFDVTEKLATDKYVGNADFLCPEGKKMQVQTATCQIEVGSQENLGPIYFENSTEAGHITLRPEIKEKITYTKTKDPLFCPFNGTGTKSDGSFVGNTTVEGEVVGGGSAIGIKVDG